MGRGDGGEAAGEPAARPVGGLRYVSGGTAIRAAALAATALLTANCAGPAAVSGRNASEVRYGVASSPRVIPEGQPVPKGGGRDMVGQPYVVAGRTYRPHPGQGYDREGWASWYGTAFHGRLTANGEIFDRESIAAAHPTLPLPSYVRVTNVVNHRSMIVRVNDRGPYEGNRVIDLSERAAEALDLRRKGVGRVRVQYVGRASLSGSDDAKLLASLRDDGAPATLDGRERRPVMLARRDSGNEAPRARPVTPPPVLATAPERDAEPSRRPPAAIAASAKRPARAVLAEADDDRGPLDIRPPRRPDLGGIY